ncbi:hypothetical protein N431DRAFT_383174 [Stipitochalara longipes BDJ]|nr:hypothetical protein N431DRAFT_383174 [Stipitochalara longipes BDJ]
MAMSKCLPIASEAARTGWTAKSSGRTSVKITHNSIEVLDGFMTDLVALFPYAITGIYHHTMDSVLTVGQHSTWYAPERLQTITFLADVTCLNAIIAIESCRGGRGRSLTAASVPLLFGLAMQFLGRGQIVPLYLFFQYVASPPSKYTLGSSYLVPIRYAKALLPALIFGYIIPTLGFLWPTFTHETKQSWNFVWQFFPIWSALFHELLARCFKDVPEQERGRDLASDLVWLRGTYEFLFLLSASTYIYVFFVSPVPFSQLFFGNIWNWGKDVRSLAEGVRLVSRWDEIFVFAGTAVWVLLCFRDLKREEKTKAGWVKLLLIMAGTGFVFGPGASMAVMCAWREELLAGNE